MIKLYHNDMSVCAQKVRLVLAHKNIEWESQHLNLRAGDQYKPDFLKINPKAVIPVLVHNEHIITESNVICYYIEEAFKDQPLMSESLAERAKLREWLTRLDAGLHEQVAIISFCLAFRKQILSRYNDEQSLEAFLSNMPDPSRAILMRDMVTNGTNSPRLKLAISAYKKFIKDLANALAKQEWILPSGVSLADFAFLPYMERLEQLNLKALWSEYPNIENWFNRVKATEAYQLAIRQWHNQEYIDLMASSEKLSPD